VWQAVELVATARTHRRRPRIQISYLLLADTADDLVEVVEAAAAHGADEVIVVHLDCTPTPQLLQRRAFARHRLRPGVDVNLELAAAAARSAEIGFRAPAVHHRPMLACDLDPRRMAAVGWDGSVAPCVHLALPIEGSIPRHYDTGSVEVEPVRFGHLADADLEDILAATPRRRFIAPFEARVRADRDFVGRAAASGWGTQALERLDDADRQRERRLLRHPFPTACHGCHKAAGW
jgi:hypothetical protein